MAYISHGNEDEQKKQGRLKNPEHGEIKKDRLIQALAFIERQRSSAREQTSPPGGDAQDAPAMGQKADRVVAATRSADSILGP